MTKENLIHLMDIIGKIEVDWKYAGVGVYDDYDGNEVEGYCDIRNTDALLTSLKQIANELEDKIDL